MQTLDIEQFNPTMAELTTLAAQYQTLTIQGIDDKEGYERVHKARMVLRDTRTNLQKTGKMLRADALKFQKAVIEKEKELIALIEPTENKLEKIQDEIDEQKERAKRVGDLPRRREKIKEIDLVMTDDELLAMDSHGFDSFMFSRRNEYLDMKEQKMKEEAAAKLKQEQEEQNKKMAEELAKVRIEQERQAKKAAEDQAKLNAEKDKIEAEKKKLDEERAAIEREKQRQIDIENAKKEAEERLKQEAELKAKQEEEEKKKIEKKKKYQDWLTTNGYQENGEFQVTGNNGEFTLWRKVSFLKIS